eukprot:5573513-Prorocentrum_lima.AAC.1
MRRNKKKRRTRTGGKRGSSFTMSDAHYSMHTLHSQQKTPYDMSRHTTDTGSPDRTSSSLSA